MDCKQGSFLIKEHYRESAKGTQCTWRGVDDQGLESQRDEMFAMDGRRLQADQDALEWDRKGNLPGDIVPLRTPPPTAQTPSVPGQWRFVKCEVGLIWDAHYIELWVHGHRCRWRGLDSLGREAVRLERFSENGVRVGSSEWLY